MSNGGERNHRLRCIGCGKEFASDKVVYTCNVCGDLLDVEYLNLELEEIEKEWWSRPISVWRYRELLPIQKSTEPVTLGEGGTGLHRCKRLGNILGLKYVYVKNEGENPTGSFKDRGMTVGVTVALELGMSYVACASTGNTAASLSAYAARAGVKSIILVPAGKVALGKLVQSIAHGARVIQVRGNFDEALNLVRALCEKEKIYLLNSLNPYRLEGQKTLSFELRDQLYPNHIDNVIVPVGNAGNISAIWKGFCDLKRLGLMEETPRMIGVQAEGAAPIVRAVKSNSDRIEPVKKPETIATAIRIGSPVNWKRALQAVRDSGGTAEIVSDEDILDAQKLLARSEGIFVEPASAASIAGLRKVISEGLLDRDEVTVCVTTGHGLKDPQVIIDNFPEPIQADVDLDSIKNAIEFV
ncbi:MAG: threonine synthase [Candidatus Bathyarchaeia archaeon]